MRINGFPYEYFDGFDCHGQTSNEYVENNFLKTFLVGKKSFVVDNKDFTFTVTDVNDLYLRIVQEETYNQDFVQNVTDNQKIILIHALWLYNYPFAYNSSTPRTRTLTDCGCDTFNLAGKIWGKYRNGLSAIGASGSQRKNMIPKILTLFKELADKSTEEEIRTICNNFCNKEDFITSNALLHLLAPDYYEPIVAKNDKKLICNAFRDLTNLTDYDANLSLIRQKLHIKPCEGFYRDDLREIWDKNNLNEDEKLNRKIKLYRSIHMEQYKQSLISNYNLILTGAPGTGKTYLAKEIAKSLAGNNYEMVQFHPSYDYSDFVEGLRPVKYTTGNIGFERKDGVFKAFCKKALNDGYNKTEEGWEYKGDEAHKYVFIIDEINRGEMSKIFGELFFSIDPGYRGIEGAIKTQYANLNDEPNKFDKSLGIKEHNFPYTDAEKENFGHFFVPKNVFIIGTMNDIDRSVESMDFAMRRRFTFKEITADERIDMWADAKLQDVNDEIKNHMQCLNYAIQLIPGLSSAYHVGPSYFLSLPNTLTKDDFKALWNSRLKGLLFEYLRGMPSAEVFLDKLEEVYNNATCLDDFKKLDIENKMKA